MTVSQPIVRAAQPSDISILSEYWYDRMALLAHKKVVPRLAAEARTLWEQQALLWLDNAAVRAVVSHQKGEIIGGVFVQLEADTESAQAALRARVLALVIDLHTTHQRHGVGRVLWQAIREILQAEGVSRVYAAAQAGDMMESTFWSSLGARSVGQWFELDI